VTDSEDSSTDLADSASETESSDAEFDEYAAGHDTPTTESQARSRRRRSRKALFIEWGVVILVALLLALGLRSFAFQAFYVPSTSMVPTLQGGDRIIVDKLFFNANAVGEGAIVVFRTPPAAMSHCATTDADLVKRVIGTPGDRLYSVGNTIYRNGKPLSEPYLPANAGTGPPVGSAAHPVVVPKGDYFVMGDNRAISCDSRYWGFVPAGNLIGQVVVLIWRNNHPAFHIF
jgi:signal peptidase I